MRLSALWPTNIQGILSEVPLPALDSTQIKDLIWLSRTLVNVMGEYFANEIVQSCGKGYETKVTKMGTHFFLVKKM